MNPAPNDLTSKRPLSVIIIDPQPGDRLRDEHEHLAADYPTQRPAPTNRAGDHCAMLNPSETR